MANPVATRAARLQLMKKELLAKPEKEEQLRAEAVDIFQTPFSIKIPAQVPNPDETALKLDVIQGIEDLTHLHGFSDMTDEARRLLHTHFDVVLGRLLLHYEKSQHRRDEGLQTAFKSSLQHALFASNITHPDQLHKHMISGIRSPALKITTWWEKYLNSTPEERAEIIKNEVGVTEETVIPPVTAKKTVKKRTLETAEEERPEKKKTVKKTKKEAVKKNEERVIQHIEAIKVDEKEEVKTKIDEEPAPKKVKVEETIQEKKLEPVIRRGRGRPKKVKSVEKE